jgi:hypothetical protein
MYQTVIKNNFFDDPDHIVKNTKKIKWIKSSSQDNWPGYRSENLYHINRSLHDFIVQNVIKFYYNNQEVHIGKTQIQFHKINYVDWIEHDKKNTRIHKDNCNLSGVIYLNKDTNDFETGTSLYDENKSIFARVSNQYNTLALYDGNLYHGATGLDKNERLIIVIFLDEIKVIYNGNI